MLDLKPTRIPLKTSKCRGFTLVEIMVVLVLIGLMVSMVQLSFQSNSLEKDLEQSSLRFKGLFTLAAEYSMLNNLELGVMIQEQEYQFLGFDGENWQPIEDHEALHKVSLLPYLKMQIDLEGLPIDENALIDAETFVTEDESLFNDKDFKDDTNKRKIIPQIYILSGGDISPFRLTFSAVDSYDEPESIIYNVIGGYTLPLTIEGPIAQ
jgi:general secretion pathway protein H